MAKNVIDKIKGILSAEDLKVFESAVTSLVKDKVALKESELKEKYNVIAEEYVGIELGKKIIEEKAKIAADYDKKLALLESKVLSNLDGYFEHVISEKISDDMFKQVALNESVTDVVSKMKKVLEESFVFVNDDSSKAISAKDEEITELKSKLNEAISNDMAKDKKLIKASKVIKIMEKTEGLSETQKKKVFSMFESASFDDLNSKIDGFVEIIKESAKPKMRIQKNQPTDVIAESVQTEKDSVVEEKVTVNKDVMTEMTNNYL